MNSWGWLVLAGLVLVAMGTKALQLGRDAIVKALAEAIAFAEGFYRAGRRPARNHNPGDLTKDLTGRAVGWGGPFVVYKSDEDGWEALRWQVRLMFGGSQIYNPNMSISQVATFYTATDQMAWAANVAQKLGVTIDTKLSELMG